MEIKASYDHMRSIQAPECDKVPADTPFPDWEEMATVKESLTVQAVAGKCPVCDGRSTKKPGLRCPECKGGEGYIPYLPEARIKGFRDMPPETQGSLVEMVKCAVKHFQPAPRETPTPETDAAQKYCGGVLIEGSTAQVYLAWYGYMSGMCENLERQRDQAREELAALQEQCQREGKAEAMRIEQLQSEPHRALNPPTP